MSKKTLSIITPVYKDASISVTFASIKKLLGNSDVEWIVIDGDYERPKKIISNLPKMNNLTYICENDNGIYDAMNKGIKASNANFLWFLNSGDKLNIKEETLLALLRGCQPTNKSNLIFKTQIKGKDRTEVPSFRFFVLNSLNHQSVIHHKDSFRKNIYDDSQSLAADYKHMLELYFLEKINFINVNHSLVAYDLTGITSKPEQKNTIRKQRINATYSLFLRSFNLKLLIMCVLQLCIYLPFIIYPNLRIKRYYD